MIDYEDSQIALWSGGGIIGLILAAILYCIASCNDNDCSKKNANLASLN